MQALFLAAALALSASTFELSGTVLDESGFPLPGATLTLVHQPSGLTRTATSNDAGYYSFPALAPGVYSLEVRLEAHATIRFAGLRYFADTKPVFNVTMKSRAIQESMTFTGEAPLINVSQSQIGLSVEEKQLHELPLARRDYLELVTLEGSSREIAEGPPGGDLAGAPLLTVNGASASYTAYQLDGFQNTRDQHGVVHADVSLEAVEEFRVVSGQFSSEYGRSLAGVVSATTASGGNDFHGSLFAFVRPGSWDAADPLTSESTTLDRQEIGFSFSGPIRRERTHFFTSFEYRNENEDVVVTAPFDAGRFRGLVELPRERLRFLFKLSHTFDSRHQLMLKTMFSDESSLEGVGGFDVGDNAVDTTNDDGAVFGTLVSDFGSVLSELRGGFASERFRASAGAPPLGFAVRHPLQGNIGNATRFERADEDHFEISETLSLSSGSHSFKTGFGLVRIGSDSELDRFGDGLYFFAPDEDAEPILFWRRLPSPEGVALLERDETHLSLFFQDDWQVSPFVGVNLGLRWEKETSVPDNDNLAPRLGFHWDATRDGRTAVRGGYGIYYSSLFSIVDSLERLYGPRGFGVVAGTGAAASTDSRANYYVDANELSLESRRSPYAQHATVGIEREWAPSLSVAIDLSYIRGSDLVLPSDVNAPSFFDYASGRIRGADAADETRPFGASGFPGFPGFPLGGYRDLYLLSSRGSSRFWGVKVNATKRYTTSFLLQAVYQWSRTRNDGDDFRIDRSLPLDPGRPELEWGRSATDVPHSFVASGVWDAPFGLRFTGIFRARSGRPADPRVDVDLDGDLKLRERAVDGGRILERNSFRAPSVATLDVSVGRSWDLGEARRFECSLDVFNATNRLNPLQFLEAFGSSFLRVVQAAPPRQFQVSVRFRF